MSERTYEQKEREDRRDIFAAAALAGLLGGPYIESDIAVTNQIEILRVSELAYEFADRMLEVRGRAELIANAPPDAPKKEG